MTFPVVQSVSGGTSGGTSTTCTMPAGITSGDLLIAFFGVDYLTLPSTVSTGWTRYNPEQGRPSGGGTVQVSGAWFAKVATGSNQLVVDHDASPAENVAYIIFRISGYTGSPESSVAFDFSSSPNSPSLTPSWGAQDTLWISAITVDQDKTISAYPANYPDNRRAESIYASAGVLTATASRNLNAASADPGAYTLNVEDAWVAWTVAIQGASAGGTITGSGALAAGAAAVSGAGVVAATITGSGALTSDAATVAGMGSVGGAIFGTGALVAVASLVSGAGAVATAVTGSGALTSDASAVTGAGSVVGGTNDIRLQVGLDAERGGAAASLSGLRYVVFNDSISAFIDSGSALTTNASGVAVIDINSSPWTVGQYAPVFITSYNGGDAAPDRVVKTFFGFVQAIAQP